MRNIKETYYCFFPVRDGESTIKRVTESLINQTIQPSKIIIVEDGSTDKTAIILEEFEKKYSNIVKVIHTDSKTRDFKRIPKLWNMCLEKKFDFHMIAAGDCIFEPEYAEKILSRMSEDQELVIASGDFGSKKSKAPHGAGRFVKQSWFFANYNKYHEIIGYESEILHKAISQNKRLEIFHDVCFDHVGSAWT